MLILLLIGSIPLYARDIEVTVEDSDLALPLEGARLRSWDGQEYTCDEEGKVRLWVPDDRQVVIQATYPGYENGRLLIPVQGSSFTLLLHLSGILENQELVIEASRPGVSETRSGRSVAISNEELSRTAEIGIVEDVMSSIKLLPGVGYAGMFNAMPSIRGGSPGDLVAVMDGFYIEQPYHWGGGVSIFDPRMVQSAQLSHGVFSARYGHTISGLLEVSSKKPSSTETELELGLSSSATNLNLSVPLWGKGGVLLMGKLTYWDPFVWAAKQFVEEVRYITTAPYIRSGAFAAHYRLTQDMEWTLNGFIGGDGMAAYYQNESRSAGLTSTSDMRFTWDNKLGFLIMGMTFNPLPLMVLKATAGAGFHRADLEAQMENHVEVPYSKDFMDRFGDELQGKTSYELDTAMGDRMTELTVNYQGRFDMDWDLSKGFLLAAGVQELYSQWIEEEQAHIWQETVDTDKSLEQGTTWYIHYPLSFSNDVRNQGFFSSAYTLMEYTSPQQRFGAELGLRLDHLSFVGKDFTIQTAPAFNPRLNLDFGILKNLGPLDSLSLTLGTGLFSSMNTNLIYIEQDSGIEDFAMKQSRSWTSIAGTKLDFAQGYSVNIEAYGKWVFDRSYMSLVSRGNELVPEYRFDGEGRIWGFDLMLQKLDARYWDGWVSYSFTHARYKNPARSDADSDEPDWYYPSFHRFHNLNVVLNLKPLPSFHIAIRFGLASGAPKSVVGAISSYPVTVQDSGQVIEKWKRASSYSDTERDGFAIPLDIKCSFFRFNAQGKVRSEIYVAVENTLAFIKTRVRNTSFNSYTGQEEEGSSTASYELPIPMISAGFKWTY
ncbi:MAG: TonB-dependent receptor plug domain-containing protein [Treponema sp.]|jgi:hypothetical protein|nr:TonB-dependent receptor plug domain-containing protein [Treponema sp.]